MAKKIKKNVRLTLNLITSKKQKENIEGTRQNNTMMISTNTTMGLITE